MNTTALVATQPQYILVAQALLRDIESGSYAVGDLLPPEVDLCRQFGVSRHTMREAFRKLIERGLVVRQRGVGTRVRTPEAASPYVQSTAQIADLLQYVKDTRLVIRETSTVIADARLAARIRCNPGQRWLCVRGSRYAAGETLPMALTEIYINPTYAGIERLIGTLKVPVHTLIEQQFGDRVVEVKQEISAVPIRGAEARALKVKPGAAGLLVTRRYLGGNGQVVEIAVNLHPGDRCSFSTSLRVQASGNG